MNFDGIIVVNKPSGWTSQDVCSKLKGRVRMKKIGHTGTLDPMATGVLPICFGKATRIIEYFDKDIKSYHATMQLGIVTDTLDITGEVLERRDFSSVTEADIRGAFANYTGSISQIPPKYSAVQINGRRAYDMARAGEKVEIKAREITIYSNEITAINIEKGIIEFDVSCSKGTYIRTICDDIGNELGCGATMTALVRTASGPFVLAEAYELADIIAMDDEEIRLIAIRMDEPLGKLGKIVVDDNRVLAFLNGHPSGKRTYRITDETQFDDFFRVYGKSLSVLDKIEECAELADSEFTENAASQEFLGIGRVVDGELIPYKVIADR